MADVRTLPVPDGLEGERVDAALARLFGLSRTKAADLAADGLARLDGVAVGKSDRVRAGAMLEVDLPDVAAPTGLEVIAEPVPGMRIVHDDDDIVVVDKPVGVAAHPSVGWSGPTVVGGLAAAGYRISTSGASERQGIVSRLDVGTSGLMVVCKSEVRYTTAQARLPGPRGGQDVPRARPGPAGPRRRHDRRADRAPPGYDYKYAVMRSRQAGHHPLRGDRGVRRRVAAEVKLETGRTHQIRVHMAAVRHPCVGDPLYGADPRLATRLGLERQWLHADATSGFEHPGSGEYVTFTQHLPGRPGPRPGAAPPRLTRPGSGRRKVLWVDRGTRGRRGPGQIGRVGRPSEYALVEHNGRLAEPRVSMTAPHRQAVCRGATHEMSWAVA